MTVNLTRHSATFWVSQFDEYGDEVSRLVSGFAPGEFWSLVRTQDEVSLVSHVESHPSFINSEGPWTLFQVDGVLDFGLIGIMSSLTKPMADAGISVFAVSTFNTDYILVKSDVADKAHDVWEAAGFPVATNHSR